MTDPIGRGDYELGADVTGVKKATDEAEKTIEQSAESAEKKYGDSGAKSGAAFSKGLGLAFKGIGVVATGAFALATKGLIELDNVTADYRRETGATAEEAKRAGKAINDMAGRNLQPMAEIGSALAAVHTQMGLTGDEAEQMTERFLRFGRATGQDATQAVKSFDDILDAWGLTAADADKIMDNLIASHQKYGGSLEDNQRALSAMAPQLRALNMTWEDGVGLLNLFASSGLDAASAQRALNSAISNLPPGQSLQDFIAHLATIPDDGARAREAITVFGQRAGAGLANAIKPGRDSIDAFKLATDQYAGATNKAADAADSTFGAQIQKAIRGFGSAMNDAFRDAGPLLTGLGALTSVGATLGVDTLLKKLAPKIIDGMKAIGEKAGDALGDGMQSIWTGAGGTVIGNNIASRIEAILAPGESGTGRAVRFIGAKLGAAMGIAMGAAMAVAEPIAAAILKIPGAAPVQAAVARAGAAIGLELGTAIALGVAGAAVVAIAIPIAQWADEGIENEKKKIADRVNKAISEGTLEGLDAAQKELEGGLRSARGAHMDALAKWYEGQLAAVHSAILSTTADIKAQTPAVAGASADLGDAIAKPIDDGGQAAVRGVRIGLNSILQNIRDARTELNAIAQGVADAIWDPQIKAAELAQTKLDLAAEARIIKDKHSTKEQVREAQNRTTELQKQLFIQIADLTTYGTDAQRIAKIKAALASKEVATAYRNGTPEQRAAIDLWRTTMNGELTQLQTAAHKGGDATADKFSGALGSKENQGATSRAADRIAESASKPLKGASTNADTWGGNVVESFAKGISGAIQWVVNAASGVAAAVWKYLHHSTPDPASPLADLVPSARRAMRAYAAELSAGAQDVRWALRGSMMGMTDVGPLTANGMMTLRVEHTIDARGAAALRDAGFDPGQVAASMRGPVDATGLVTNLRQIAARLPSPGS
jgi:Phage-related minor tail protein